MAWQLSPFDALKGLKVSQSTWDFYNSSPEPVRKACIAEWQVWLAEIGVNSERQRLENDLRSSEEQKHFSARLVLYFHHYFKSQGCRIDFHPKLKGSGDHPDFLVHHERGPFYLEATIRHDERSFGEMEVFADLLKEELKCICSPHRVYVSISEPCPKKTFLPEIKGFLENELLLFNNVDEVEKDVVWSKSQLGTTCELSFSLHRGSGACQPLAVSPDWGGYSGISGLLYDTVAQKARKYGELDLPLVIAVWGLSSPDQYAEEEVLYGTVVHFWRRDPHGNEVKNSGGTCRRPDGVFTLIEDGQSRNRKVSAVVFYEHRLGDTDHQHILRVYHNPYAPKPLPQEIFDDAPQFVPVEVDDHGEMRWRS